MISGVMYEECMLNNIFRLFDIRKILISFAMIYMFHLKTSNMSVPGKCPMCGEVLKWKNVDEQRKGFSVGKAAVGGLLLGPVGLLGGALGKSNYVLWLVRI